MIRPDCHLDFWKERFISELPPLFADKVRTKIQDHNDDRIPYSSLTYGDLVKKDKSEKKSHKKKSQRRDDSTRPRRKKSNSKRPKDAKTDVCWTCGKTGHKANACRSKTKKKKINLLIIDEETKGKVLSILDEPSSESSGTSDEYSDDEDIDLDYESDASKSRKDCTCTEAFCTSDSTPQNITVLSDHSK
ncbi:hypothetical protein KY285_026790 [Solanum tuberosum]|nr:hypothetical protein KY285_026790 [Solanum tuberosum]